MSRSSAPRHASLFSFVPPVNLVGRLSSRARGAARSRAAANFFFVNIRWCCSATGSSSIDPRSTDRAAWAPVNLVGRLSSRARGAARSRAAANFFFVNIRWCCSATGSSLDRPPLDRSRRMTHRRSLAPTFRADISRWDSRWPDAALYPLASAPPPRADRHTVGQQTLTRSRRLLAAGADCSFWCNSESGRTLELGRSGGTLLTSAAAGDASCGVIANGPVDIAWRGRAHRRSLAPTFRADISRWDSRWPDAALYPLASAPPPRADRHTVGQQTLTRSRRLLAAGADCSFWCNSESGRTLELGRSGGTLLTSAAAGDASCGVIANGPVDIAWRGRAHRRSLAPTFRADISRWDSRWPDAALYPLASAPPPRADRHTVGQQTLTRSRRLLAAGADCSFWCNSESGRTLELGRSGGTLLTSAAAGDASCGVIANGPVDIAWRGRAHRRSLAPTFRADISRWDSRWPDAALYPLASAPPPRADRHTVGQQTLTRSRRLLAAGADCSFWCNSESGRTLELGRSGGTLLTSAAAGDASCGVIANGPVDIAWRGRAHRRSLAPTFRADISRWDSRWPDAALYPLASAPPPRADRHTVGQQTLRGNKATVTNRPCLGLVCKESVSKRTSTRRQLDG